MKILAELTGQLYQTPYLAIADSKEDVHSNIMAGGNQSWWADPAGGQNSMDFNAFNHDHALRMQKMGCGIIAMCDAELFLCQKYPDYQLITVKNEKLTPIWNEVGTIAREDYMRYIDKMRISRYVMGGRTTHFSNSIPFLRFLLDRIDFTVGLNPILRMAPELRRFFRMNGTEKKKVRWARYCYRRKPEQKRLLLSEIKRMLTNQIPVVFAYYVHNPDGKSKKKLSLYQIGMDGRIGEKQTEINDHYMTIIGLYEEEKDGKTKSYCKVVSWGKLYYMDYDAYAEQLSFFSNILSVW